MKDFPIFPWDRDEVPHWVNPENGLEWYIDKETTKWCRRQTLNDLPKLEAYVFYVAERKGDEVDLISRVLIDKNNNVLADETSLEALAVKIDVFRLQMSI